MNKKSDFIRLSDLAKNANNISEIKETSIREVKANRKLIDELGKKNFSDSDIHTFIGEILDLKDDLSYCDKCPGYELCSKSMPHYRLSLKKDGNLVYREYVLCDFAKDWAAKTDRYFLRDFPDEYLFSSTKKYRLKNSKFDLSPSIYALIKAGDPKNKIAPNWFYITGSIQGRTALLTAFSNDFADKNHEKIAYCDTANLIDSLRTMEIDDKNGYSNLVNALITTPLLVLDAFGDEYKSEFALSTALFPILRERSKKGKMTIFSSDFSLDEIEEMYSEKCGKVRSRRLKDLIFNEISQFIVIKKKQI